MSILKNIYIYIYIYISTHKAILFSYVVPNKRVF